MTCSTCNGRGWVPRHPGDQHGDACPACFVAPTLIDDTLKRRRRPDKQPPKPKKLPLLGKPTGTPTVRLDEPDIRPLRETHNHCLVEGCSKPPVYGQRLCRGHYPSGIRKARDLTEAETQEARSLRVFLSDAQIARRLHVTAADVRRALGR